MRCEECGFVYEDVPATEIADRIAAAPAAFRTALAGLPPERLTTRSDPEVWSPLEYTCHMRDVFLTQRERAIVTLVEDGPTFTRMYRDERVESAGYDEDDLTSALAGLEVGATLLSRVFRRATPEQLARSCNYNLPTASLVDLVWVGRHTVHEGEHHLLDITRQT